MPVRYIRMCGASGTLRHSACPLPASTSLRYHNLHPDYIHERLQSLGKNFALRVLLVQVDVVSRAAALASFLPCMSRVVHGLTNPL